MDEKGADDRRTGPGVVESREVWSVCAPKSTRVAQKHVTYASFVAQRLLY
jgi:hypothetical protein